jgi:hypothetical protein
MMLDLPLMLGLLNYTSICSTATADVVPNTVDGKRTVLSRESDIRSNDTGHKDVRAET